MNIRECFEKRLLREDRPDPRRSGRSMEVLTTQPGLLFYSGNYLDATVTSRDGGRLEKYSGVCLETHHYPNSPNVPSFPSVILKPGELYESVTLYRFSTNE